MVKTIELRVYGMTCDDCVTHVSNGLKSAGGVKDVDVSLENGMAIVKTDNSLNPEDLLKLSVFNGKYRAQLRSVKDE